MHEYSFQKEHKASKNKEKGGPFRLNSHPKDFFDENPYHSKKCKRTIVKQCGVDVERKNARIYSPNYMNVIYLYIHVYIWNTNCIPSTCVRC